MLSISDLADAINVAIDARDKDGNLPPAAPEMIAYATAVVNTLQAAVVANTPGSVSATALPVPSPILAGSASGGTMTLMEAVWTAALAAGFPTADSGKLSSEATASTGYIASSGTVNFASGGITGLSTATPITPGILTAGEGSGGTVDDLVGDDWAASVVGSQGLASTAIAKAIFNAISTYINANAEAAYATGSINGVFTPGGGSMTAGTGVGGTIS